MATYKNKKTDTEITTDLIISGGDWERVEDSKKKAPAKGKAKEKAAEVQKGDE